MDVTKQTIVDSGVTLTITAGTTVQFATGTGITVQGPSMSRAPRRRWSTCHRRARDSATTGSASRASAGADSTHCNMHFEGAARIAVTHSNISGAPYGLMLYGGIGVDLTYN